MGKGTGGEFSKMADSPVEELGFQQRLCEDILGKDSEMTQHITQQAAAASARSVQPTEGEDIGCLVGLGFALGRKNKVPAMKKAVCATFRNAGAAAAAAASRGSPAAAAAGAMTGVVTGDAIMSTVEGKPSGTTKDLINLANGGEDAREATKNLTDEIHKCLEIGGSTAVKICFIGSQIFN